jgi:hypothetical protein
MIWACSHPRLSFCLGSTEAPNARGDQVLSSGFSAIVQKGIYLAFVGLRGLCLRVAGIVEGGLTCIHTPLQNGR